MTPMLVQMCSDCNTSVYWESRLLTEPNWATPVAGREFLSDRKILYLRPSSLGDMIFMPSRCSMGPSCSSRFTRVLVLGFQLPKPALGHIWIRGLTHSFYWFFGSTLCKHWAKFVPQIICLLNIFSIRNARRAERTIQVFSVNCRCFLIQLGENPAQDNVSQLSLCRFWLQPRVGWGSQASPAHRALGSAAA